MQSEPIEESVILVDKNDVPYGLAEKLYAHQEALLHRAFSVFLFRKNNINNTNTIEVLLQKRSLKKYHCGGLWTNTCCSHPRYTENIADAASRRLLEELNLSFAAEQLCPVGFFIYKAELANQLYEHELDHVLIGRLDTIDAMPDIEEIDELAWVNWQDLKSLVIQEADKYTPWLNLAMQKVEQAWKQVEGLWHVN